MIGGGKKGRNRQKVETRFDFPASDEQIFFSLAILLERRRRRVRSIWSGRPSIAAN